MLSERGGWVPHENEGANRIRTRGIVGGPEEKIKGCLWTSSAISRMRRNYFFILLRLVIFLCNPPNLMISFNFFRNVFYESKGIRFDVRQGSFNSVEICAFNLAV